MTTQGRGTSACFYYDGGSGASRATKRITPLLVFIEARPSKVPMLAAGARGHTLPREGGSSSGESRNRTLTDIVAPRDAALRLASFEAFAGLLLLVQGEDRLAAEFNAVGLGVGPAAARCALECGGAPASRLLQGSRK